MYKQKDGLKGLWSISGFGKWPYFIIGTRYIDYVIAKASKTDRTSSESFNYDVLDWSIIRVSMLDIALGEADRILNLMLIIVMDIF